MVADVYGRAATSTRRYGGTVNQFTGDGIMAVFGAPVALEDHAFRACLAALDIQEQIAQQAGEVQRRDGVVLRLRVGLNSGRVIAGEIGSGPTGYTAVGEQVGLAQRMESVARGWPTASISTTAVTTWTTVGTQPCINDTCAMSWRHDAAPSAHSIRWPSASKVSQVHCRPRLLNER